MFKKIKNHWKIIIFDLKSKTSDMWIQMCVNYFFGSKIIHKFWPFVKNCFEIIVSVQKSLNNYGI